MSRNSNRNRSRTFEYPIFNYSTLFTNILLDETIDICVEKLFKIPDTLIKGISKNDYRDLLNLATNNHFLHLATSFIFKYMLLLWGPL